ncbi:MAG: MATE family efflux transporter [Clostridia bacterium]|nr:MATE family efflux transporter [Clostridia bacterium]
MKSKNVEMCSGSLFINIIRFAIPFMITGILQRLYNSADIIVAGRWGGEDALAGVGASGSLITLVMDLLLGLSMGISVVLGKALGEKNDEKVAKTVHTSIALSIIGGAIVSVAGIVFAEPLLRLTDVPDSVMPQAMLYMQIMFAGKIPAMMYVFGSAILRAKGNTKAPMYIITATGIVNIVLNILFVAGFGMKADGVAIATVISQILNAASIVYILTREEDATRLDFKKLKVHADIFPEALKVGLPAGIQSSVFGIANVIIQTGVNGFGDSVIAGCSAAGNIIGYYYFCLHTFNVAAVSFVSQNVGARKFDRVKKTVGCCALYVVAVWIIELLVTIFLGEFLMNIYAPGNAEAIRTGLIRMQIVGNTYVLCGLMEVFGGSLRGLGYSASSMIMSVTGVCGIRILWVMTVFKRIGTLESLYMAMPLSWIGTLLMQAVLYFFVTRPKRLQEHYHLGH